jgi:alkylation response protein AidB-like acyl-CoA dehydrogenase
MSDAEQDRLILDSLDRFLEHRVKPQVQALEHDDVWPAEIVAEMQALGLFGATISADYGGLGLGAGTYAKIVERVSGVWMSLAGIFNSHLIMAAAVERFGTAAQKATWLPRFASGEMRGGPALTEPDCGTDLQAIRMVARRDGPDYLVNGTKTWISNGIHGEVFALLVKTDLLAAPRHRGISLFLAEKGPGFTVGRKLEKLGYKGIDTAELIFSDYRVPADRLIGGVEGRGLQQALGGLELGRINVAARGVGIAQAALDAALAYAQIRKSFGKPIAQHQTEAGVVIPEPRLGPGIARGRMLLYQRCVKGPAVIAHRHQLQHDGRRLRQVEAQRVLVDHLDIAGLFEEHRARKEVAYRLHFESALPRPGDIGGGHFVARPAAYAGADVEGPGFVIGGAFPLVDPAPDHPFVAGGGHVGHVDALGAARHRFVLHKIAAIGERH